MRQNGGRDVDERRLDIPERRTDTAARAPAGRQNSPANRKLQTPVPVRIDPGPGFWQREKSHYPKPVTPATRSVLLPAVNRGFRIALEEVGVWIETLEVRDIGGWIYQRAVPLGDGRASPDGPAPLTANLARQLADRVATAVRFVREDCAGQWLDLWRRQWKPFLAARTGTLAAVSLKECSDQELVQHLRSVVSLLTTSFEWHLKTNVAIQYVLAQYAFAAKELVGWDDATAMEVCGGRSAVTTDPARLLADIAARIRVRPDLVSDIESGAQRGEIEFRNPEIGALLAQYTERFGLRLLGYELAEPTVAESDELLWRLLRDQIRWPYRPEGVATVLAARRERRIAEAGQRLGNRSSEDRARFFHALQCAENAYPIREAHGFYDRDVPLGLLRLALLEAGKRMAQRGQLQDRDDVFYLELGAGVELFQSGASAKSLVLRARGEHTWALRHPGPATYGTIPSPSPDLDALPPEARFAMRAMAWATDTAFEPQKSGRVQTSALRIDGVAASEGRYQGTVRIVTDESDLCRIEAGDILVSRHALPVWSVAFASIGALVTDAGGSLSHAAIIAREYGIPAVVATGNASRLLKDGETVLVDGTAGVVRALRTEFE